MHIPSCPTQDEKYSYVNQSRLFYYSFGLTSLLLLCVGTFFFLTLQIALIVYGVIAVFTVFYLLLSYAIGISSKSFDLKAHELMLDTFKQKRPSVDIWIPSCNEPIQILKNTYQYAVHAANYYGNATVWALDDAGRNDVIEACFDAGVNYITRPNKGEMKKAGNLLHAFRNTKAEYYLVLDCDFAPRKDILCEMVPYMYSDDKIAIVQSPQFFSYDDKMSFIEKGAAQVQELFYRMIQMARDYYQAAICVGSCALYRRSAFPNGPYQIGYSEDVHTGWDATTRGYRVKYIPIALAKGTCPDVVDAFFVQQYRWSMGTISLMFNKEFWVKRITVMQRICYLSGGMYYIATAIDAVAFFIPPFLMVYFCPEHLVWYSILFTVPSLLFSTCGMWVWSLFPFGVYSLVARRVSYYAHISAIIDKLRGDLMPWSATGQVKKNNKARFVLSLYELQTVFVSAFLVSGIFINQERIKPLGYLGCLLFLAIHLVVFISYKINRR